MPTDPFGRPVRGRSRNEIDLGPYLKPALFGLLALAAVVLAFRCVYTVQPNERAVLLRFGEFTGSTIGPGLHFRVPLVDTVEVVSVEEHSLRLPQESMGADRQNAPRAESLMLTGELYAANVEWTVQWKVAEADRYLFAFDRTDSAEAFSRVVATVSTAVMNRLVGDYSIDEVLTSKRGDIEAAALEGTQAGLDEYDCGVRITDLQLQRVTPPAEVKAAFDDVVSADQDQERLVSEANKDRARLLNESEAAADKLVQEAQGYADRRRAEADGEIAALRAKFQAYQLAPDVTRQRLYLEAMQDVLGGVGSKTILDADLESLLPLMQLNADSPTKGAN